ncbi:preprotein translocase subunit SecA, partial [bacterium]|nr:preprotein translocase subunit SecA [bacterium]
MDFLKNFFGGGEGKKVKDLKPLVEKINGLESVVSIKTDEEIRAMSGALRKRAEGGESLDDILPEAFALVREAAKRTLGQRHYDVQLMGGMVLHQGGIAEMKTGEGKTLVATLPAYLNALAGKGVHIVTVNDYLSRRDAVWMGQVHAFLGLSVSVINNQISYIYDPAHKELDKARDEQGAFKVVYEFLRPCSRKEAYAADITYGTNNEFGFDYLRDNIAYDTKTVAQRGHPFAIVDEIDSILIDEARTPLIISAPSAESENLYETFNKIAARMKEGEDYTIDEKLKAITITDDGIEKAEKSLGVDNIYTEKGIKYVHHLETAVRAKALFVKDRDYVVKDGEVVIVDEFTGRLQPGRRWSEGLHQAIEAKEGVSVQKESRTVASITFQNYFRMYEKLSGMTGTAQTSQEEFFKVYKLEVSTVPTNKESRRVDHHDLIFQNEKGKFTAVAKKIKELHGRGQPVLVGTVSIEKNELLGAFLEREGIPFEMLNAKNHEREGEIIAQAGTFGRVTIATNMAGRGVDIILGGNPGSPEAHEKVRGLGGLFVIGTERHEARRIDNQLRGRAGRQGDPGETQFMVSLEDSLMRVFASDTIKKVMGTFKIPEDEPITHKFISKSLESAQEKIEGFHFDARKHVLAYDDVLNRQRTATYERRRKILFGERSFLEAYLAELFSEDEKAADIVVEKRGALGDDEFFEIFRRLALQTFDMFWIEHLELMDYTRSSVNLRAYGQRDPLVEYQKEGLRLFREMGAAVNDQIIKLLPTINVGAYEKEMDRARERAKRMLALGGGASSSSGTSVTSSHPKT